MKLQEYKRIDISKDQILPTAEKMRKEGRYLVMIHAFINKEGLPDISWDYAVDPIVESYHVVGESVVPSIGEIYSEAAIWPEREINELFGFTFEDMLETQGRGQIMVTPLKELVEKNLGEVQA